MEKLTLHRFKKYLLQGLSKFGDTVAKMVKFNVDRWPNTTTWQRCNEPRFWILSCFPLVQGLRIQRDIVCWQGLGGGTFILMVALGVGQLWVWLWGLSSAAKKWSKYAFSALPRSVNSSRVALSLSAQTLLYFHTVVLTYLMPGNDFTNALRLLKQLFLQRRRENAFPKSFNISRSPSRTSQT